VKRENEFHALFTAELKELEKVLRRLDVLVADVPVEGPWQALRALERDAATAGAWYDAQGLSPVARALLQICTVGILAVPTAFVYDEPFWRATVSTASSSPTSARLG
jgi:monoamine oxidase